MDKGLLAEIANFHADVASRNYSKLGIEAHQCTPKWVAVQILAKIREVVEGAGLSDVKLLQKLLGLPDVSTITEYAAKQDMAVPPGSYFKAGANAQRQAILKAIRE